jgi:hypothetical protein
LCFIVFFELLPGNFSIKRPIVGFIPHISFNVSVEPKANFLQVVLNELLDPVADQISLAAVIMNNCALLDYNPPPHPPLIASRR